MLKERAERIVKNLEGFEKYFVEQFYNPDMLLGMSGEEFEMMKKMKTFFEETIVYMIESADMVDEINRKLDILISRH